MPIPFTEDEFNDFIELDLYHLDEAYLKMPQITETWNNEMVEAEIASINAKSELDDKKSFLDKDIRENPGNYGMSGKLTEGPVKAEIEAHPDVVRLNREYVQAQCDHKRLKSKCNTIDAINKSLSGLTKLYEAGYFGSKPICAMPKKASEIVQEKEVDKLNANTDNVKRIKKAIGSKNK